MPRAEGASGAAMGSPELARGRRQALCCLALPRQRRQGEMAWQALVLALCLSLAVAASADCATQCSLCAAQTRSAETSVRPLVSAGPTQPLPGGVTAAGVSRVLMQSWVLPGWWLWAPQGAGSVQASAPR